MTRLTRVSQNAGMLYWAKELAQTVKHRRLRRVGVIDEDSETLFLYPRNMPGIDQDFCHIPDSLRTKVLKIDLNEVYRDFGLINRDSSLIINYYEVED